MDIKFITLTNEGYLDFTINCIRSLKKIGDFNLTCYSIGSSCCDRLKKENADCVAISDDEEISKFHLYRQENWEKLVCNKFLIIKENLLKHEYVCITDGDVVFENNFFMDYCKNNIGDKDLLIQNDLMEDSDSSQLCSGFMFIKSNELTLNLFDFKNCKPDCKGWGDQIYINQIKKKLKYEKLPLNLYPNGQYYYKNFDRIRPYMIHFNWVIGHDKKSKMLHHKKWYM
jgi:hypothetical protein